MGNVEQIELFLSFMKSLDAKRFLMETNTVVCFYIDSMNQRREFQQKRPWNMHTSGVLEQEYTHCLKVRGVVK